MPPVIPYPMVNGHRFAHQSWEWFWAGILLTGVSEVNFSDELAPGEIRGTAPQVIGRTRGLQKSEASISLWYLEWDLVKTALAAIGAPLGQSFGEVSQSIRGVAYEAGTEIKRVELVGARVSKVSQDSSAASADGTLVKLDLSILRVRHNGLTIATPRNVGI
jgi:hypothetical protein